jgi:hypothetical protein
MPISSSFGKGFCPIPKADAFIAYANVMRSSNKISLLFSAKLSFTNYDWLILIFSQFTKTPTTIT